MGACARIQRQSYVIGLHHFLIVSVVIVLLQTANIGNSGRELFTADRQANKLISVNHGARLLFCVFDGLTIVTAAF